MRRTTSGSLIASAFVVVGIGLGSESPSRADGDSPKFDGRWKQSALREDFAVQQWLDAGCGPPPQSTSTGGGEVINIRTEGDELTFVGGGRVYHTNQCYDPMPTLSRASHSRASDGKTWRTRCVTPPADPRKTVLNTLVVATTPSHIDLIETGRYEITLENGRCMADVKRTRSFDLVDESAVPAAKPPPSPVPAPTSPPDSARTASCASPGEPSKLEVRPSKKLLRTGETFRFTSAVLDAKGCATRTPTSWKLAPDATGKGVEVDATGTVTVTQTAAEGSVEIVVTAAGKDTSVFVEVTSPARYDELLARSGLNAAGENDEASTATIASQSIGAGEGRVEDRSRQRRLAFLGIVGAALVVLAGVAFVALRRSRRAKSLLAEADERHEERVQQVLDRRKQREQEHAEQMRAHVESVRNAESLKSAAADRERARAEARAGERVRGEPREARAAKTDRVCTSCGRTFPDTNAFCPHDGSPLRAATEAEVPLAVVLGAGARPTAGRGKICPTCGERFDGAADYCGKDGTQLVLVN
jgi:hypothetical protein